ncbi:hypothetical protein KIPB_008063, partial [Kipferlia bialata]|eukprot:g8063.t1
MADPTQLKAIRHTLNHRVSVIRGGPGTGKSYTAKLLLRHFHQAHASHALQGPVLLVTMTNQALDTLMEGILEFADPSEMLRIGGSTKSLNQTLVARQFSQCKDSLIFKHPDRKLFMDRERAVKDLTGSAVGLMTEGQGSLADGLREVEQCTKAINEEQHKILGHSIRSAGIVFLGMTSTACAKQISMLNHLRPSVCLVEEAGELREGQLIASLPSSLQQLVLIGDEQQLQPKVEHALKGPPVNYGWSMFERLTRLGVPRVQLKTQRRMRPEICGLVNYAFDQGLDTDTPASLIRGSLPTIRQPLFFLHHNEREASAVGSRSHINVYESQMLVNLVPALCGNGYTPADITIIALYKGQMYQIQRDLEQLSLRIRQAEQQRPSYQVLRAPVSSLQKLKVVTLDDFQGQENKVVLVSLTRSDRLGFVAERNRALVTLSRAKEMMVVIGHSLFLDTPNRHWSGVKEFFEACDIGSERVGSDLDTSLVGIGPALAIGCPKHGE